MRMSVKKDDPGYSIHARKYEVFLNGEKLHRCHTADEEKGIAIIHDIERYEFERKENPYVKFDKNEQPINEIVLHSKTLFGKIEIRKCKTS